MYESPSTLQDVCLDFISENIPALCETQTEEETGETSLVFRGQDVVFPAALSDQLLLALCHKKQLTDEVLTLFNPQCAHLKRVKLRDAPVTTKGLKVLKQHKIWDIEAVGLTKATINDLISCLGEWTLTNLRNMNVMNNTFTNSNKCCVVVALSKLRHLQALNVSNTTFNKQGLDIVSQDLVHLECLDISNTPVSDLSPLRKMKDHLKSLSIYNVRTSHMEDLVSILCDLVNLHHLDLSDDFSAIHASFTMPPVKMHIGEFLEQSQRLKELMSLDISGKTSLTEEMLKNFLDDHPKLHFLGLSLTTVCDCPMFTDPNHLDFRHEMKMTGDANQSQLIEALRRYPNRMVYVQRTLYHLFRLTQSETEPTAQLIKLILPAMKAHPKELGVQMAATACLYNLSRGEGSTRVHPVWLSNIVSLTLDAMENFPNHKQLQKNALLTLCSDRILQENSFDRFRCADLVMRCLCSFEDPTMDRMSVAICGILAAKIPTEQTSRLGTDVKYMRKLLSIVDFKTKEKTVDITLKFTLSALWNLTDESPVTCEVFLAEGGLELFATVLETFRDLADDARIQVETKVLGLVNNLAEVQYLRSRLLSHAIMNNIRELLHADRIDVSYFAAGIISHLVSNDTPMSGQMESSCQALLHTLGDVVLNWEQPEGEMVAYRSFRPFFPLLARKDLPQVQLWAVWAMHHVCTKSEDRYCGMLIEEGGALRLWNMIQDPSVCPQVMELASHVVSIVDKRMGRSWRS